MFLGLDIWYADTAQPLRTAGEELDDLLDDLDDDLCDLSEVWNGSGGWLAIGMNGWFVGWLAGLLVDDHQHHAPFAKSAKH